MGDTPWKVHERAVAHHFGTEREKRGSDFSVSDCDVLVNIDDWYAHMGVHHEVSFGNTDFQYTHIVVECKYRADLKLHQWMRNFAGSIPNDKTPVLFWDSPGSFIPEYGICWMEDFNSIWQTWMHNKHYPIEQFTPYWAIGYLKRKIPAYLEDWWTQAYDYCCELQKPPEERSTSFRASDERVLKRVCVPYPLVSVRGKGLKGRLMVWKLWWEPSA